jgi:hypothetical protein
VDQPLLEHGFKVEVNHGTASLTYPARNRHKGTLLWCS